MSEKNLGAGFEGGPVTPSERIPENPALDLMKGDVVVSQSGNRREVLEVFLNAHLPGGGEIKFLKTGPKIFRPEPENMTFEQYAFNKKQGIFTVETNSSQEPA